LTILIYSVSSSAAFGFISVTQVVFATENMMLRKVSAFQKFQCDWNFCTDYVFATINCKTSGLQL